MLHTLREHDGTRPLVIVASVRAALQPVSPHAAHADRGDDHEWPGAIVLTQRMQHDRTPPRSPRSG